MRRFFNTYNRMRKLTFFLAVLILVTFITAAGYFQVWRIGTGLNTLGGLDCSEGRIRAELNVPSDIEGWTRLDKWEAGLTTWDGSDSDRDGLTDKEEIEVYGTDPLKASTADDMYYDAEKVALGLDLFTHCDRAEEPQFPANELSNVHFTAECIEDTQASAQDCTGLLLDENYAQIVDIPGYDIFQGYFIKNAGGKVSFDETRLIELTGRNPEEFEVFIADGAGMNAEKCDAEISGNVYTPDYEFSHDVNERSKTVIFAKKNANDITNLMASGEGLKRGALHRYTTFDDFYYDQSMTTNLNFGINNIYDIKAKCVVSTWDQVIGRFNFMRHTFDFEPIHITPTIKMCSTGNDKLDALIREEMVAGANIMIDNFYHTTVHAENPDEYRLKPTDVEMVSDWEYLIFDKRTTDDVFDPYTNIAHRAHGIDMSKLKEAEKTYSFYYSTIAEHKDSKGKMEQWKEGQKSNTGFTYEDTLPFKNFASLWGPTGNCAGIAQFTIRRFLNDLPEKGEVETWDREFNGKGEVVKNVPWDITWNLTKHPENKTLLDKGLHDYRYTKYNMTTGVEEEYMDADIQFISHVGVYQLEGNLAPITDYMSDSRLAKNMFSWDTIKNVTAELDAGRPVIFATTISTRDGQSGHVLVLYDYEYIREVPELGVDHVDTEMIAFDVYDCNYPDGIATINGTDYEVHNLKVYAFKDNYHYEFSDGSGCYLDGALNIRYLPYIELPGMKHYYLNQSNDWTFKHILSDQNWNTSKDRGTYGLAMEFRDYKNEALNVRLTGKGFENGQNYTYIFEDPNN